MAEHHLLVKGVAVWLMPSPRQHSTPSHHFLSFTIEIWYRYLLLLCPQIVEEL
jgi:hypothetical protein